MYYKSPKSNRRKNPEAVNQPGNLFIDCNYTHNLKIFYENTHQEDIALNLVFSRTVLRSACLPTCLCYVKGIRTGKITQYTIKILTKVIYFQRKICEANNNISKLSSNPNNIHFIF